jgi:hypothetical protein
VILGFWSIRTWLVDAVFIAVHVAFFAHIEMEEYTVNE